MFVFYISITFLHVKNNIFVRFTNKLTEKNVTEKQLSSSEKQQIHVYWKHLWQKRPVVQSNWHKNLKTPCNCLEQNQIHIQEEDITS